MKIGLIDNDLIVRDRHSFPNLALMKLSQFHKNMGNDVKLIGFNEIDPNSLFGNDYDEIYVSKAFTDSNTPDFIYKLDNVNYGGTGFFFDKAQPLSNDIEHSKPDYDLYHNILHKIKKKAFYIDYSIGFTTRGCFRHCEFCVNQNSNKVMLHSPIDEFYDERKPKLAMLDDNILGLPNRELFKIFDRLGEIGKPFQYRQAMDIRLLTNERIDKLLELKYDDIYYYSFDKWSERNKIEPKLNLWSKKIQEIKPNRKWIRTKIYVFCAFDYDNKWDESFWINDIIIIFKRLEIIFRAKCAPYLMRYERFAESPFYKIYNKLANWCNSPKSTVFIKSFNDYIDTYEGNDIKEVKIIRDKYPEFRKIFDLKF